MRQKNIAKPTDYYPQSECGIRYCMLLYVCMYITMFVRVIYSIIYMLGSMHIHNALFCIHCTTNVVFLFQVLW